MGLGNNEVKSCPNQPRASGSFHLISVPLLGLLWGHARLAGGGYCLLLLGLVSKLLLESHFQHFTISKKRLLSVWNQKMTLQFYCTGESAKRIVHSAPKEAENFYYLCTAVFFADGCDNQIGYMALQPFS